MSALCFFIALFFIINNYVSDINLNSSGIGLVNAQNISTISNSSIIENNNNYNITVIAESILKLNCSTRYYGIFLIFLSTISVSFLAFLAIIYSEFDNIIAIHNTISSYCSDPDGYGNRFLLTACAIIGPSLIALNILQQSVSSDNVLYNAQFILTMIVNINLPLVGIFYTRGKGLTANKYYALGPWKMPILISDTLHCTAALSWLLIQSSLNMVLASSLFHSSAHINITYLVFCILSLIILSVFLTAQGAIFLIERKINFNNFISAASSTASSSPSSNLKCSGPIPQNRNDRVLAIKHQNLAIQVHRTLYIISFITEGLTIILVTVLALIGAILQRQINCSLFL